MSTPPPPSSSSSSSSTSSNTDKNGFYTLTAGGQHFSLSREYKLVKKIGEGAFGCVIAAEDVQSKEKVAIKKITPVADEIYNARRTLREIMIMRLCSDHPNIVSLRGLCIHRPNDELYIIMELMMSDLFKILSNVEVNLDQTRVITKQILNGLEALKKIGVIHRDIKPGNILVSRECQVKISDFGLARFTDYKLMSSKIKATPSLTTSSSPSSSSSFFDSNPNSPSLNSNNNNNNNNNDNKPHSPTRITYISQDHSEFLESLDENISPENLSSNMLGMTLVDGTDSPTFSNKSQRNNIDNDDNDDMKVEDKDKKNNTQPKPDNNNNTKSNIPQDHPGFMTGAIKQSYRDAEISKAQMTDYVVTRWYRAPELILSPQLEYNDRVDIWSVGCILAEMMQGRVLFQGNSSPDQIRKILRIQGCPEDFNFGYELHPDAITFLNKEPKRRGIGLKLELNKADKEGLDLVEKMLIMNPEDRWDVHQTLQHPFLSSEECPDIPGPKLDFTQWCQDVRALPCNVTFERNQATLETVRNCLEAEINEAGIHENRSPSQVDEQRRQQRRRRSVGFKEEIERRGSINNTRRRSYVARKNSNSNSDSNRRGSQSYKEEQPSLKSGNSNTGEAKIEKEKDDEEYKMEVENESKIDVDGEIIREKY